MCYFDASSNFHRFAEIIQTVRGRADARKVYFEITYYAYMHIF